jgi:hypothetical protein
MASKGFPVAGGVTMGELVAEGIHWRGVNIEYTNPYGSSWDQIHQTLLDHAGRDGILLEVELAYALTGNEPGVHRHYVAIGAIHPTLGYLVANGDDVRALNSAGGHGHISSVQVDAALVASVRDELARASAGLTLVTQVIADLLAALPTDAS